MKRITQQHKEQVRKALEEAEDSLKRTYLGWSVLTPLTRDKITQAVNAIQAAGYALANQPTVEEETK